MKKLCTLLISLFACLMLAGGMAAPVLAISVVDPNACAGEAANSAVCQDKNPNAGSDNPLFGPTGILTRVINILAVIVGVAAVVVIMISGLRMTVSQGDPNTVATARRSLLYAVAGLVIAVLAQTIVILVLKRV